MNTSFLQSPEWAKFQSTMGARVKTVGLAQIFVYSSPLGIFWYAPHVTDWSEVLAEAKKQGVLFVRFELFLPVELPKKAVLIKPRQPESTLVLDLNLSEIDLLGAMHQKTRYNIRLAEKKDLKVVWQGNPAVFNALMQETSKRDHFNAHSDEYYTKMLDCDLVEQGTVYLGDQPIASAIFIGYDGTYTYLHGASSNEHRELMAPYLLQWSAIRRAKQQGFKIYDFWGIAPEGVDNHRLAGVTRFKLGFGGTRKNFGQAFEIPLKPFKYRVFNFLKKIRL